MFCDDDAGEESATAAGKKPDKGKGSIAVFRDEEPPAKGRPVTPSTPGFTPYRDSDEVRIPLALLRPTLSVLILILAGHTERRECTFQRDATETEGSTRSDRGGGTQAGSVQELRA